MAQAGWRVLAVDLDHQGSLSQLLLSKAELQDVLDSRRLVHEVLADRETGKAAFLKAIVRAGNFLKRRFPPLPRMKSSRLWRPSFPSAGLVKATNDDVRYRLRAVLHADEIARQFDFILLDCPPRLTTACINALAASDYVLIPVLPNPVSTDAVPGFSNGSKTCGDSPAPILR